MAAKQGVIGELQSQVLEAEGRLDKVKADLARGAANPKHDLANVQELEEILTGLCYSEAPTEKNPREQGNPEGDTHGQKERAHPTKEEGADAQNGEGVGAGGGTAPEDPPPHTRPRTVDEEDKPLKAADTVAIDRKILLMLVKTVKELKEGVKKGQESRTGSPARSKAYGSSEDEDMQEEEGFD